MILQVALAAFLVTQVEGVLQAGRDAPAPTRTRYVAPQFPLMARQASPPLMGVVVLEVTLDTDGRPVDIRVLYGIPLLDAAAIDAVKEWRYAPTVVDGAARRVVLREVVDLFPDAMAATRYFATVVESGRAQKALRVIAANRLAASGRTPKKFVVEALQKASEDPDPDIKAAAARALDTLASTGKTQ